MKLKPTFNIFLMVVLGLGMVLTFSGCFSDGHDDHAGHDDHDDHAGHDEHEDEKIVTMSSEEMKTFEIELATAGPGSLQIQISLPGEVVVNADRLAHVVPRVGGIVRDVKKTVGDTVKQGEVVAILDSRELADAKAEYLASMERKALAESIFNREKDLLEKKITSEQEFLQAKQALAETRIVLSSAEKKLHALGFSETYLAELPTKPDTSLTRYEVTAPFDGTIIEKHITLGESVQEDSQIFVVADLTSVWVNLSVYQKDLPYLKHSQPVELSVGRNIPNMNGKISFISPVIDEETRTAYARVVIDNAGEIWRPGFFVTASIVVDEQDVAVLIARSATQVIDDQTCVFVKTSEGFEPVAVKLGKSNHSQIEVLSGIAPGDQYVIKGAFTLKAELAKGSFGDGHNH